MESPNSNKWQRYATDRNRANKTERDEKRAYERRLTEEIRTNRKGFFKYVNSKLTVRPEISALINENGELVHDEKEMSNICNCCFHASFTRPTGEELPEMDNLCNVHINNIEISAEMVQKKLERLNKFKSSGPD